jgi:hypothetical protein
LNRLLLLFNVFVKPALISHPNLTVQLLETLWSRRTSLACLKMREQLFTPLVHSLLSITVGSGMRIPFRILQESQAMPIYEERLSFGETASSCAMEMDLYVMALNEMADICRTVHLSVVLILFPIPRRMSRGCGSA